MPPTPSQMKAVVLPDFGIAPEVRVVPVPEPAQGEVRVRVHAASVNGFDVAVANGYAKDYMEHRFPVVLGRDFAGTVDAVGAGVTEHAPGDRVFGVDTKPYVGGGSFAEYVAVAAGGLAPLPQGLDYRDGAALGLAGTTARLAVDAAQLAAGQTVLIVGATGGVGTLAVQLAAQTGARVIATAHGDEARGLVTALGAAEVVDYTRDLGEQVRASHPDGVDAALHLAGDPAAVLPLVRHGGRLVSTLLMSPDQLPGARVTVRPVQAHATPAILSGLAEAAAAGRLRTHIQRRYRLDEAPAALHDFARQGTLGKLVVDGI